ncbi:MAG: HNH endonuclease signature motif containing protein [Candidatus Woesearchaeota archaeon]
MRYPRLKDIEPRTDADGNKLCRNCSSTVPKKRRVYCSDHCMNAYVKNNYWFFVRRDVLRRDKFRCSICGERKSKSLLDVDHIIPVRLGGQVFDKQNLRTLCKECHKAKSRLDRDALKDIYS